MIPGLGRLLGEGNGKPFQYSYLGNSMDRGSWWATVHGIAESDMTERLTLSLFFHDSWKVRASLVAQTVKRLSTMRETWVLSLGWEDPLEKAMAIHSSTIARKIPWIEEPGRLQSMGSKELDTTEWLSFPFLQYYNVPPGKRKTEICLCH